MLYVMWTVKTMEYLLKDNLPVEQFPALERVSLHYQRDCLFVLVMMETQVHFALGAVVKQVHPGCWEISQYDLLGV